MTKNEITVSQFIHYKIPLLLVALSSEPSIQFLTGHNLARGNSLNMSKNKLSKIFVETFINIIMVLTY